MRKKLAIVASVFIACTITINVISNNEKIEFQDENNLVVRKKKNLLSYYLENDSGDYIMSSGENWPTTGYLFNATLSKCENGGELSWDDTRKVILMTGKMSDKCYIYFDKLILPTITASVTEVTDSTITINSTSNKGTFDVNKYYYSKDKGTTFTESNSNTYTFSSLDDSTTYNIVVYVDDTKGNKSSNYTLSSTTKASKPVINSITVVSADWRVIKLNIQYTSKNEISTSYIKAKKTNPSKEGEYFEQQSRSLNEFTYYIPTDDRLFCNGGEFNFTVYIIDNEGNKSETYTTETVTVSCFTAGTKIFTKNGYKNIEDIRVNDIVYSYNETTNKVELNKVTKTFIHEDIEIYNLYLNNEIIRVTPYHRFYVLRNNNYEWIAVKDLKLTDKLLDSNNELININKIEYMKENNIVYNFEVANNHTYYVSESNILVHNVKGC